MSANAAHIRGLFGDREIRVPKVAFDAINRPAMVRWLTANAGVRVRVVAAQPGAGKTTALALWLRSLTCRTVWIDIPRGATERALRALVADACDEPARCVVVIDNVDRAGGAAKGILQEFALHAPAHAQLVFLARSATALDLRDASPAVAPSDLLRFDADDVRRLCDVHDVPTSEAERRTLVRAANGWAVVIAGAVRTATLARVPLEDGLARWRRDDGRIIASLIDEALETATPDDAAVLRRMLSGEEAPTSGTVARLADAGLFAQGAGQRARLNPVVMAFPSGPRAALDGHDAIPVAEIEMFGTFRVRISGQEIRFARRRDRNIVAYLALRPDGKATRDELLETFWPGGDRALARQGLRTACSMIRRAFAAYVGEERVDAYFSADAAVVVLHGAHTENRLKLFVANVERARAADTRGATHEAEADWYAALRLFIAPVLASEDPHPAWMARVARDVHEMASEAARRLHTIPREA